jgi:hypothetical protein
MRIKAYKFLFFHRNALFSLMTSEGQADYLLFNGLIRASDDENVGRNFRFMRYFTKRVNVDFTYGKGLYVFRRLDCLLDFWAAWTGTPNHRIYSCYLDSEDVVYQDDDTMQVRKLRLGKRIDLNKL